MENNEDLIPDESTDFETGPAKRGSGAIGKIKVLAFLLAVVLVECAVAAMVIPSADETTAMAQARNAVESKTEDASDEVLDSANKEDLNLREIDVGEFGVTAYQPLSNTTLRIDFHLFATVLAEDESELLALLDENEHRFREQVLVILRSSEMTDLTDAGLGLIKRKILEKTNRTLGKSLIREMIFSDFSFIEQ